MKSLYVFFLMLITVAAQPLLLGLGGGGGLFNVKNTETITNDETEFSKKTVSKDSEKITNSSSLEDVYNSEGDRSHERENINRESTSTREKIVEDEHYQADKSSTKVKEKQTSFGLKGLLSLSTNDKTTTTTNEQKSADRITEINSRSDSDTVSGTSVREQDGKNGYNYESDEYRNSTISSSKSVEEKERLRASKSVNQKVEKKVSLNVLGIDISHKFTKEKAKTTSKEKITNKIKESSESETEAYAKHLKYSDDGKTVLSSEDESSSKGESSKQSEKQDVSEAVFKTETNSETESGNNGSKNSNQKTSLLAKLLGPVKHILT